MKSGGRVRVIPTEEDAVQRLPQVQGFPVSLWSFPRNSLKHVVDMASPRCGPSFWPICKKAIQKGFHGTLVSREPDEPVEELAPVPAWGPQKESPNVRFTEASIPRST